MSSIIMNKKTKQYASIKESYQNIATLLEDMATGDVYGGASDGVNSIENGDNYATGDMRIPKAGKKVQKRGDVDSELETKECDCDELCTCNKTKKVEGKPL